MGTLLRTAAIRARERAAGAALAPGTLMERAGRAAAGAALSLPARGAGPVLVPVSYTHLTLPTNREV